MMASAWWSKVIRKKNDRGGWKKSRGIKWYGRSKSIGQDETTSVERR